MSDTSPLVLDSLRRRMRALHSLYHDAVESMDVEHVNHFEREGVLPIAFSLFHIVNMIDASFMLMTGTAPIWGPAWQERVRMGVADHVDAEATVEVHVLRAVHVPDVGTVATFEIDRVGTDSLEVRYHPVGEGPHGPLVQGSGGRGPVEQLLVFLGRHLSGPRGQ